MRDPPKDLIAKQAFDRLAAGYDRAGDHKPSNAYLERPATRSLLPAIDGTKLLDAGCGAGQLTRELIVRADEVVGLDASHEMISFARERAPTADFVQADLGSELPFHDDSFDGIVSSLAFHYVKRWVGLFRSLYRILRQDGWIVFSVQHPHADFVEYPDAENYHEIERVSATWDSFGEEVEVPAYRRPLSAMLAPALDAGFQLDAMVEPEPTEEYRQEAPERYKYEATNPNFLCLRLVDSA